MASTSRGVSRPGASPNAGSRQAWVARAQRAGLSWPDGLDDALLELRLDPPPAAKDQQRPLPRWAEIHRELKRPGVTLQLLWQEYREEHPSGSAYSRFCDLYRAWEKRVSPTMRQTHIAGERMFRNLRGQDFERRQTRGVAG